MEVDRGKGKPRGKKGRSNKGKGKHVGKNKAKGKRGVQAHFFVSGTTLGS